MQTKNLFGIFLLSFWAFSFMECSKDDKIEDEMDHNNHAVHWFRCIAEQSEK